MVGGIDGGEGLSHSVKVKTQHLSDTHTVHIQSFSLSQRSLTSNNTGAVTVIYFCIIDLIDNLIAAAQELPLVLVGR